MFTRKDIEERENIGLAPYAMKCSLSKGRKFAEDEHPYRSIFQRDKDRVIHCTSFRRLEYKTQVFVNHEGDYYRTRLTHTMEVTQISRSIARALNLNEDLTEAIALSHDLGHTPFGHSGEDALEELMKGHGGFDHNFHALRVVDLLEKRYPEFPGLNLSWEVKESILKHGFDSNKSYEHFQDRFDCDERNQLLIKDIFSKFDKDLQPLLEAQLVDIADSIAYDNHDIDDGLKAGIINENDLKEVELWRFASEKVKGQYDKLDGYNADVRIAQTIKFLIDMEATNLIEHTTLMINEYGIKTIEDVRNAPKRILSFSPELANQKKELQEFLLEYVYKHYRVIRMADKAKRFIEELFTSFIKNPRQLPPEFLKDFDKIGLYQSVCDYIAGMTDRYVQDEYKKLFNPYERV
ncbi:MAG: deoxyguanosinetriphosphate triphosphohydrolase [Candidatus Anammoxibacter sp.]